MLKLGFFGQRTQNPLLNQEGCFTLKSFTPNKPQHSSPELHQDAFSDAFNFWRMSSGKTMLKLFYNISAYYLVLANLPSVIAHQAYYGRFIHFTNAESCGVAPYQFDGVKIKYEHGEKSKLDKLAAECGFQPIHADNYILNGLSFHSFYGNCPDGNGVKIFTAGRVLQEDEHDHWSPVTLDSGCKDDSDLCLLENLESNFCSANPLMIATLIVAVASVTIVALGLVYLGMVCLMTLGVACMGKRSPNQRTLDREIPLQILQPYSESADKKATQQNIPDEESGMESDKLVPECGSSNYGAINPSF